MKPLFALFGRSIRLDLRSKAFFWSRMGAALGVLWVVFRAHGLAPGLTCFTSLVAINFLIICFAAVSYFSAAITEEKEEGTLGLLQLTDLSPFSILIGKSTSKLVGGFLVLLVQVPFAMFAITLGGVRLDQVIDSYLLLAGLLFFACNAGLLASVIARRAAGAGVLTAVIMVAYFGWPFLWDSLVGMVAYATGSWNHLPEIPKHLATAFAAPIALQQVLDSRVARPDITANLGILIGGGLTAFLFARFCFARFCSEEFATATKEVAPPKGRKSRRARREFDPGRAWDDAVFWRDFHFLHGGKKGVVLKALVYLAIAVWVWNTALDSFQYYRSHVRWWFRFSAVVFGPSVVLALFESLYANSRIYRLEHKEKTLSALYVLPQSLDHLLLSKRRAALLSLLPGLFLIGATFLLAFPPIIAHAPEMLGWVFLSVVYLICQTILNHYLVGWLSLTLRWGAFPVALGIIFLGNYLTFIAAQPLLPWSLLPLIAGSAFLAIQMRRAFHESLVARAAEG